jgi:hypothetical protein
MLVTIIINQAITLFSATLQKRTWHLEAENLIESGAKLPRKQEACRSGKVRPAKDSGRGDGRLIE